MLRDPHGFGQSPRELSSRRGHARTCALGALSGSGSSPAMYDAAAAVCDDSPLHACRNSYGIFLPQTNTWRRGQDNFHSPRWPQRVLQKLRHATRLCIVKTQNCPLHGCKQQALRMNRRRTGVYPSLLARQHVETRSCDSETALTQCCRHAPMEKDRSRHSGVLQYTRPMGRSAMPNRQKSFDLPKVWVCGFFSACGGCGQPLRGCLFSFRMMVRLFANHQTT